MASMRNTSSFNTRQCKNSPDSFCYICGSFLVKKQKQNITETVKKLYNEYFMMKLGDQDKVWAPHVVCRTCVEALRNWKKEKKASLPFGIPMVWREQKNHYDDCYFCMINTSQHKKHKEQKLQHKKQDDYHVPVTAISDKTSSTRCRSSCSWFTEVRWWRNVNW